MELHFTGIYTSILTLMFIGLRTQVSIMRGKSGISILHGDNTDLALRIRRHGNFVENAPLAIILMIIAELMGASGTWVHAIGLLTVAGRVAHIMGLKADQPAAPLRIIGGVLGQVGLIVAVVYIVKTTFG